MKAKKTAVLREKFRKENRLYGQIIFSLYTHAWEGEHHKQNLFSLLNFPHVANFVLSMFVEHPENEILKNLREDNLMGCPPNFKEDADVKDADGEVAAKTKAKVSIANLFLFSLLNFPRVVKAAASIVKAEDDSEDDTKTKQKKTKKTKRDAKSQPTPTPTPAAKNAKLTLNRRLSKRNKGTGKGGSSTGGSSTRGSSTGGSRSGQ